MQRKQRKGGRTYWRTEKRQSEAAPAPHLTLEGRNAVARGRFPWAKPTNGEAGDVSHPERSEVLTEFLQENGSHHARVNSVAATIKTGMWADGDRASKNALQAKKSG